MAGHAFPRAGETQLFLGGGLHIHPLRVQTQGGSNVFFHPTDVILQLGLLGNHGHVDVAHPVALLRYLLSHDVQQHQRIRPLILGVGVRKMPADVSQSRRSQQCVGYRVEQHICVAVTVQTQFIGNLHPAQNQVPARHQPVNIISMSDSHSISSSSICAIFRSMGVVTFRFRSSPSTIFTFMPICSTAEQSSVTCSPSCSAFANAPRSRS